MATSETLFPDADAIHAACVRGEPEALSLEFKEKSDASNPIPQKDDRKNIAKSVSAMANGAGGTIVFGVKTKRIDGADCACEARPIRDISAFERQFLSVVHSCISPQLTALQTRIIEDQGSLGSGFLICDVQTSLNRPHMSIGSGEHTYYRRTFQGDQPMTPLEVKEQILSIREAQLGLIIRRGGSAAANHSHWLAIKAELSFSIENTGRVMAKNPFLRASSSPELTSYAPRDPFTNRHKSDFPPGLLLHVGDSIPSLTLCFFTRIMRDDLYRALSNGDILAAQEAVKVFDGTDDIHSNTFTDRVECESINIYLLLGAENSTTSESSIRIDQKKLRSLAFYSAKTALYDYWGRGAIPWLPSREVEAFGTDESNHIIS